MPERDLFSNEYDTLIHNIGSILDAGRKEAFTAVNQILTRTYWEIGKNIVLFEQAGKNRANYGDRLLINLSKDLKSRYGKGFSRSNLQYMRQLFIRYQKCQTLSGKLSWSHYIELLAIEDDVERGFYEKQCEFENWSVRQLKRQIGSALFQRIALSKSKKCIEELSTKGNIPTGAENIIKDPYVFEFLDIEQTDLITEKQLENRLIGHLQGFLLELGKGFTFVSRQFRISLGTNHYYVDLVFYHRILKCFVLIDLKKGKVDHSAIGQMNMYLNYFKKEENTLDDNEPIGIVLGASKETLEIEYALGGISNQLFVSKYQLYLPNKLDLQNKLAGLLD